MINLIQPWIVPILACSANALGGFIIGRWLERIANRRERQLENNRFSETFQRQQAVSAENLLRFND